MKMSATKVMNTLLEAGLISSWKWKQDTEFDCSEICIDSNDFDLTDETYGKDSFLYFACKTMKIAKRVKECLRKIGLNPNGGWCPQIKRNFELQVAYFKGWHWRI